jgi:hypothetical protein
LIALGALNLIGFVRQGQAIAQGPAAGLRSVVAGVVHGLAGSAALGLLVLATVRDPAWAVMYLLLFGAGTVAGMVLITSTLMAPLAFLAARFRQVGSHFAWLSGTFSLAFGMFLAYRIGVSDGLLIGAAATMLTP